MQTHIAKICCIIGCLFVCGLQPLRADSLLVLVDEINNKLYRYDFDQPGSLTQVEDNASTTFNEAFDTDEESSIPRYVTRSDSGSLVYGKLQDPLTSPLVEYTDFHEATQVVMVDEFTLYVDKSRASIVRMTNSSDPTTLYFGGGIVDLINCGDDTVCFVFNYTRIGMIQVSDGTLTTRDSGFSGEITLAFAPSRGEGGELIIGNKTSGTLSFLPISDFVLGSPTTITTEANDLRKVVVVPGQDTQGTRSIAYLQASTKVIEITYLVGAEPPSGKIIIDTEGAFSFSHLSAISTPLDGGSGGDGDQEPACSDGIDNDADSKIDYPNDPGCANAYDTDEADQCNDESSSDSDNDGYLDCADECPDDGAKVEPLTCGCGVSEIDSDGDGVPDCIDQCPNEKRVTSVDPKCSERFPDSPCQGGINPNSGKCEAFICEGTPGFIEPGCSQCGEIPTSNGTCSTPDSCDDADDCNDLCPSDPYKITPGDCGCGVPDRDSDGDGVLDCDDGCPLDGFKESVDLTATCGLCSSYPVSGDESKALCANAPEVTKDIALPAPQVSIKNGRVLLIDLPAMRIPGDSSAKFLAARKRKASKKQFVEYTISISQFDPSKKKTKKIKRTTEKNRFKTAVKRGTIVSVRYEAKVKKKGRKREDGSRKITTVTSSPPSRPTTLIAR